MNSLSHIPSRYLFVIVIVVNVVSSSQCFSRPISYADGYTFTAHSDWVHDALTVHYSPTQNYSYGVSLMHDHLIHTDELYLRYAHLLGRINTSVSQSNLYLRAGVSTQTTSNHFIAIDGDWETRKLFAGFGFESRHTYGYSLVESQVTFGYAPYVGDFGDLHTWLMLRMKYNTDREKLSLNPTVRLFKNHFMAEFGYSRESGAEIALTTRFDI